MLVIRGDDDQSFSIADFALLAVDLLKYGTLKSYKGLPHGLCTTFPDVVNPDLLVFIEA